MRARVLFAGLVALSTVVIAGPASAKASIARADITGPGLEGGLTIRAREAEGLWESGIDVAGGLDDTRSESVKELGLTRATLGPRYLVTYRFDFGDVLIRQDLYPYAEGGPVTYTPSGQELNVGINMTIMGGWYQSSSGFFHYLVDHGLPETNPVPAVAARDPLADIAPAAQTSPWAGIVLGLMAVVAVPLIALAVRHRVLAGESGP